VEPVARPLGQSLSKQLGKARVVLATGPAGASPTHCALSASRRKGAMNQLKLTYKFELDDDFGWLGVEIRTERFSGRGGFWVQWQEVEKFGQSLRTYPIRSEAPLLGAWGYEPWEGDALVIRIEVAPANSRGDLKIGVELADHYERSERVRTSFHTNYPQLEAFSDSIEKLMKRNANEAVLLGS
jgi:hypothetical protein